MSHVKVGKLIKLKDDQTVISLDLGDVIFNNTVPKILFEGSTVRQLHKGVKEVITGLISKGFKVIIISKIDPGDECRVSMNLFYHQIVPHLIKPEDVHFCYERKDKGEIAKRNKVTWHVDDRAEVLAAVHESEVPNKILFTASNNESEILKSKFLLDRVYSLNKLGFSIATNWEQVLLSIVCPSMRLPIT